MIDQMHDEYFPIKLTSTASLNNIVSGSRLDLQQLIQLAGFQLRDSEERRNIVLCCVASIIVPAFLAATLCHLHSTVTLLDQNQTILTRNASSDLFTFPILAAH